MDFAAARFPILCLLLTGGMAMAGLAGKSRYDHGNPTDLEQLALELLNRARSDPTGEADRLGIGLNAGLPDDELAPCPRPPLAFHPDLLASARGHSRWMLEEKSFSHTGKGGSSAGDRMAEAGYLFLLPYRWGENIGWEGVTGHVRPDVLVRRLHRALFASPTHRLNLLDDDHDEVGIGIVPGKFPFRDQSFHSLMLTENFARSAGSPVVDGPFLLGVVFRDQNRNGSYDPGEGLPGISVTTEPGSHFAISSASGGYALPLGTLSGRLAVVFTGPHGEMARTSIDVADHKNIKVDGMEPPAASLPAGNGRQLEIRPAHHAVSR